MSVERGIRYELLARLCPNTTGAFSPRRGRGVIEPVAKDATFFRIIRAVRRRRIAKRVHGGRHVCHPRAAKGMVAPGLGCTLTASMLIDLRVRVGRARPQLATEKDFLEAVNKVIKGYKKFSATPRYMTYN